jgi:hypothetical protein
MHVSWPREFNVDLVNLEVLYPGALSRVKQQIQAFKAKPSRSATAVVTTEIATTATSRTVVALHKTYDAAVRSLAIGKQRANELFRNAVREIWWRGGQVVYLEAENGGTTACVADAATGGNFQCVAVNFDPAVLQAFMLLPQARGVLGYNGWLHTFNARAQIDTVAAMWFDYCGAYRGNRTQGTDPIRDIQAFVSSHALKKGGVMAFTFCRRSGTTGPGLDSQQMQEEVHAVATKHGYAARNGPLLEYGSMTFFIVLC